VFCCWSYFSLLILIVRLDRRHPGDVFEVFWPRLAGLFAKCYGHTADGVEIDVFAEVVPRSGRRARTIPPLSPALPVSSSCSLLDRRLVSRPDLDLGALRHLRERLTLAIPSRQVSDPMVVIVYPMLKVVRGLRL
jgi:hypothetical protein